MIVKIKKLSPNAKIPQRAHSTDAGCDLTATSKDYDNDGNVVYGTGLAFEIPLGYMGLIFPRSSNAKKDLLLSNSVGVIDSGYRGEVMAKFKKFYPHVEQIGFIHNISSEYNVGDRFGQIIIMPYPEIEYIEVDELSDSERKEGGYGSSGK